MILVLSVNPALAQESLIPSGGEGSVLLIERESKLPTFISTASTIISITTQRLERVDIALKELPTVLDSIRLRQRAVNRSLLSITELLMENMKKSADLLINHAEVLKEVPPGDIAMLKADAQSLKNRAAMMRQVMSEEWICPVSKTVKFYDSWKERRPSGKIHHGVDLVGFNGADLYAPVDGEIVFFWDTVGGRSFGLTANNGDYYFGTHLLRFGKKTGTVSAGDVIGQLGSGGNATGPHLHFEYHPGPTGKGGGDGVNPYLIANRHCRNRIPMSLPLNHSEENESEGHSFSFGNLEWD